MLEFVVKFRDIQVQDSHPHGPLRSTSENNQQSAGIMQTSVRNAPTQELAWTSIAFRCAIKSSYPVPSGEPHNILDLHSSLPPRTHLDLPGTGHPLFTPGSLRKTARTFYARSTHSSLSERQDKCLGTRRASPNLVLDTISTPGLAGRKAPPQCPQCPPSTFESSFNSQTATMRPTHS